MSRKMIMLIVLAGTAVLLAAGIAVAASGGTGRASAEKKCASAAGTARANAFSERNQGEEGQVRSEHCEQAAEGECAGECERLREQLRERDGDGECPCDGTGEQFRKGCETPTGEEAAGAEGAVRRYGSGYVTGGTGDGNCAGDCLRERDRARDCARDGSGGA